LKAIDSNLLVYACLANHPAMSVCEQFIAQSSVWLTNVVNLIEMHRVLVGVYGVSEGDADRKFMDYHQALVVEPLTGTLAETALPLRAAYGIDFNDAVLLQMCREHQVEILGTDDGRLATACSSLGMGVENPIDATLRTHMAEWEAQWLPAKGLPRILRQIHRWLERKDAALAADFHASTQALSRLV